jgi:isoaspartyl peptidase/L-asparaginase-like protein (Ntn-hydrolase superfamily)
MGCSAYANQNIGCSLTGHEECIMKLNLSRIIASDIEEKCSPWKALKENLDYMLNKYNRTGGGIAFKKSGEWGVYFTAHRMPYAIIANDHVTFGTTLDEKNVEKYTERHKLFPCTCNFFSVHELQYITMYTL